MKLVRFTLTLGSLIAIALPALSQEFPGAGWNTSAASSRNIGPVGQSAVNTVHTRALQQSARDDVNAALRENKHRLKKVERLLSQSDLTDKDRQALLDVRQGLVDEIRREEGMLQNS